MASLLVGNFYAAIRAMSGLVAYSIPISAQETHIISDNYGSDHRPIVATLQLD